MSYIDKQPVASPYARVAANAPIRTLSCDVGDMVAIAISGVFVGEMP